MATWSDNDELSSNDDTHEEANLYLNAYENEVTSDPSNAFTFDELQETFYDLLDDLKKLGLKNKQLKMQNQCLVKEKKDISAKNKNLIQKKLELKN